MEMNHYFKDMDEFMNFINRVVMKMQKSVPATLSQSQRMAVNDITFRILREHSKNNEIPELRTITVKNRDRNAIEVYISVGFREENEAVFYDERWLIGQKGKRTNLKPYEEI